MDWPELAMQAPGVHEDGAATDSDTRPHDAEGTERGGPPAVVRNSTPAGKASGADDGAVAAPVVAPEVATDGVVPGRAPRRIAGIKLSWTSVLTIVVVLVVAGWIGRGLIGGGSGAPNPKAAESVAVPKPAKTHMKTVDINGAAVPAAGVLITLNPAIAQPGGQVTLTGQGFDARSIVDVILTHPGATTGTSLGSFRTDRVGNVTAALNIPDNIGSGAVTIVAKERNSSNVARIQASSAAGLGYAKAYPVSGKPGDTLSVSARGFGPGEMINVYWGRVSGPPTSTLQADGGGTVGQASVKVGFQPPGAATMVLVGAKTGTTATVPFYMQALYPTANTQPYSLKAGETLGLSGNGFAPNENVDVWVNASSGRPLATATADGQGSLGGISLKIPYGLKGQQRVVLTGALSRASVTSGFDILPYTPTVQPSTYGGAPGTSFSFFSKGFAANEVVLVYLNRTPQSAGQLVSAFRVNDQGSAGAAGSYQIGAGDSGTLHFTLVGRLSDGRASTSVRVNPAEGPVDLPTKKPYTLPPSLRKN